MDPLELEREAFLRNLQALQAQTDRGNGPFMNRAHEEPRVWERRVGPERRYGAFSFCASVNSKRGIQSLGDILCITMLCSLAGLFLSLGFILYIKPLVHLILCWVYGFTNHGNEYIFSLFLALKSGIAIAITLIDQFAPETSDSIWRYLKSLLLSVENVMTSKMTALILAASAFQCNITNPHNRAYCHPVLFGAVMLDIVFELAVHIGNKICGIVGENYSLYWLYRIAVCVIKSFLRTLPIRPNMEAGFVGAMQQFKRLYEADEGLRSIIGSNADRHMDEIIDLIRCRTD